MTTFHSLKISNIHRSTPDSVVLTLAIPEALKGAFKFTQGQYITFKKEIAGEEIRRSYSLCSSPLDGEWKVAVKKIEAGRFSTFANDKLKAGEHLEVLPPNGKFYVLVDPTQPKSYVAFAAGSGITPILSIIKTHLLAEPQSTFKLFYINKTASSIMLKEALEGLKNTFLERLEIFHFLTREERGIPLLDGRINQEKLATLFDKIIAKNTTDEYFICGPNEMIFLIKDYLQEIGVNKQKIHFELFNTDGIAPKQPKRAPSVSDQNLLSEITIQEGGKSIKFSIPRNSDNILDAALKQNADLPFACKGGVCCTCRAKLIEGEVEVLVNYGLEQEEIDNGFILTCQSIPTSEKVVVDFDASLT